MPADVYIYAQRREFCNTGKNRKRNKERKEARVVPLAKVFVCVVFVDLM